MPSISSFLNLFLMLFPLNADLDCKYYWGTTGFFAGSFPIPLDMCFNANQFSGPGARSWYWSCNSEGTEVTYYDCNGQHDCNGTCIETIDNNTDNFQCSGDICKYVKIKQTSVDPVVINASYSTCGSPNDNSYFEMATVVNECLALSGTYAQLYCTDTTKTRIDYDSQTGQNCDYNTLQAIDIESEGDCDDPDASYPYLDILECTGGDFMIPTSEPTAAPLPESYVDCKHYIGDTGLWSGQFPIPLDKCFSANNFGGQGQRSYCWSCNAEGTGVIYYDCQGTLDCTSCTEKVDTNMDNFQCTGDVCKYVQLRYESVDVSSDNATLCGEPNGVNYAEIGAVTNECFYDRYNSNGYVQLFCDDESQTRVDYLFDSDGMQCANEYENGVDVRYDNECTDPLASFANFEVVQCTGDDYSNIIFSTELYTTDYGSTDVGIECTQEAMECDDGTYVSRVPPDCEFESCNDGDIGCILNALINIIFVCVTLMVYG